MISSRNRTALFTLFVTALGILCIPLDMLLSLRERRLLASAAAAPAQPTVFLCGPARSGTTLAFQILCRYLDVAYLRNVTALFPRSPIVASRIYRRMSRARIERTDSYRNFYGKTSGLGGPSEANHVWNRWVRPDATGFRTKLSTGEAREAARFFSAFCEIDGKAMVFKNNNMNVFADAVAGAVPNLLVICLRRSPEFLAQSLLQARRDIHGSLSRGYGVQDVDNLDGTADPVASVCAQVAFLDRRSRELRATIGPDRFWIVDYEEVCRHPGRFVASVAEKLAIPMREGKDASAIAPIPVHNVVRDQGEMELIRAALAAGERREVDS